MMIIVQKCIGKANGANRKDSEKSDANYGALIAIMLREYGGTPDQWLYDTPVEKIGALVEQYVNRVNAEQDASRGACAKKGVAVAPPPSAKLVALKAFKAKMNEIKQKWTSDV